MFNNTQLEPGMIFSTTSDSCESRSLRCVAGETPILTKNGYYPIQYLVDREIEVWNGNEWSLVTVKLTSKQRHLITVYFSNGRYLTCTPDHKFMIGDGPLKEAGRISAQYLIPGLKLRQEKLPIVEGPESFKYPYLHGALCAFGCFTESGPILDIMGVAVSEVTNHPDMILTPSGAKIFPNGLPLAYTVPINTSVTTKIDWLNGFITTRSFPNKAGIVLVHINSGMMRGIQLMLTTLGIRSYFEENAPNTVETSENKTITVSNCALLVPWFEIEKLRELGLKIIYKVPESCEEDRNELMVTEIIDTGRLAPTFCFVEEKNNAGIFNGILTGQCQEKELN